MKLGNKIQALRKERKLTMKEVANKAGISTSYLNDIEKGRTSPSLEKLLSLARALNTTPSALLEQDFFSSPDLYSGTSPEVQVVNVPVFKETEGKTYSGALENTGSLEMVLLNGENSTENIFYLSCPENSMNGSLIHRGDLVLIRKQKEIENGAIHLFQLPEQGVVLRRAYHSGNHLVLQADNSAYAPVVLQPGQEYLIIGKAEKVLKEIK